MGMSTDIDGLKLIRVADEPIVISGPPDRLQAMLIIENSNAERITLKSMPVDAPDLYDTDGDELEQAHIFGRIDAKHQAKVMVEFPIDSSTAAGSYQVFLRIGDENIPATIVVNEQYELDVEPDTVTLHAASQLTFEQDFTVTNTGNVTLQLGQPLIVPVEGDGGLQYALRTALQKTGEQLKVNKGEARINDVLRTLADQFPGPAHFSWQTTSLEPGESKLLRGHLQLPDNLQANHHYSVMVELYSSAMNFDVFTLQPTDTSQQPPVIK